MQRGEPWKGWVNTIEYTIQLFSCILIGCVCYGMMYILPLRHDAIGGLMDNWTLA